MRPSLPREVTDTTSSKFHHQLSLQQPRIAGNIPHRSFTMHRPTTSLGGPGPNPSAVRSTKRCNLQRPSARHRRRTKMRSGSFWMRMTTSRTMIAMWTCSTRRKWPPKWQKWKRTLMQLSRPFVVAVLSVLIRIWVCRNLHMYPKISFATATVMLILVLVWMPACSNSPCIQLREALVLCFQRRTLLGAARHSFAATNLPRNMMRKKLTNRMEREKILPVGHEDDACILAYLP